MGGPSHTPPQPQPQGTAQAPIQRTGETLTVGCRLPNGLVLQLHDLEDQERLRPDGTTFKVKVAVAKSQRVVLNGNAKFRGGEKETLHDIRFGTGLTFGVDAAFFHEWMRVNAESDAVRQGLIFAHRSNDTVAQAKDHRHQTSGLEPLDPKNLPDEFKGKIQAGNAA